MVGKFSIVIFFCENKFVFLLMLDSESWPSKYTPECCILDTQKTEILVSHFLAVFKISVSVA